MLLVACSLALLVIYAGMKLLAQTKKETLGNFYKYVSLFLVIVGFLLLICISCSCMMRCCNMGERMMERKCMMMEERNSGGGCEMGGQMGSCKMMSGHGANMGHCCGAMMMNKNCCAGKMESCGSESENCHDKMEGECHGKKEECAEGSEGCEMKKGEVCKKDTLKKKK